MFKEDRSLYYGLVLKRDFLYWIEVIWIRRKFASANFSDFRARYTTRYSTYTSLLCAARPREW